MKTYVSKIIKTDYKNRLKNGLGILFYSTALQLRLYRNWLHFARKQVLVIADITETTVHKKSFIQLATMWRMASWDTET